MFAGTSPPAKLCKLPIRFGPLAVGTSLVLHTNISTVRCQIRAPSLSYFTILIFRSLSNTALLMLHTPSPILHYSYSGPSLILHYSCSTPLSYTSLYSYSGASLILHHSCSTPLSFTLLYSYSGPSLILHHSCSTPLSYTSQLVFRSLSYTAPLMLFFFFQPALILQHT
jgi:hypothetical protein